MNLPPVIVTGGTCASCSEECGHDTAVPMFGTIELIGTRLRLPICASCGEDMPPLDTLTACNDPFGYHITPR